MDQVVALTIAIQMVEASLITARRLHTSTSISDKGRRKAYELAIGRYAAAITSLTGLREMLQEEDQIGA